MRAQQTLVTIEDIKDLLLVPDMITRCQDMSSRLIKLIHHRQRHQLDAVLQEEAVGNDDVAPVGGANLGAARADLFDCAVVAFDLHHVARARTGRSSNRISPLMKLFITFWLPNPIPIAIAPPRNANAVNGTLAYRSAPNANAISNV